MSMFNGRSDADVPSWVHNANGFARDSVVLLMLSLASVAQLPELVMPMFRAKSFRIAFAGVQAHLTGVVGNGDHQAAQSIAESLGLTGDLVAQQNISELFNLDAFSPRKGMRSAVDAMFKYNGMNAITRFFRRSASTMAYVALRDYANGAHADPRYQRYLAELGVTAEQVRIAMRLHETGGKPTNAAELEAQRAYEIGFRRFVRGAILHPSRADQPLYHSDARFAFLGHLQSFTYAIWEQQHRGLLLNELKARAKEHPGLAGALVAGASYLPFAIVMYGLMVALGGLSDWLRELIKNADKVVAHGDFNWSDTDLQAAYDRAGISGPLERFGTLFGQSYPGSHNWAYAAGPSVDLMVNTVLNGDFKRRPSELVPIVRQVPWMARPFNQMVRDMTQDED
jgi:hypothetical protein